jgi:hypothetical protein
MLQYFIERARQISSDGSGPWVLDRPRVVVSILRHHPGRKRAVRDAR